MPDPAVPQGDIDVVHLRSSERNKRHFAFAESKLPQMADNSSCYIHLHVQTIPIGNGGELNQSTCELGRSHQRPEHAPPPVCATQAGGAGGELFHKTVERTVDGIRL